MHESDNDLESLQRLMDRSYAAAGEHLLSIHTPQRRLTAAQVAERLQGCWTRLSCCAWMSDRTGRPIGVVSITTASGRIVEFDVVADPDKLRGLTIG